jgi:Tfp pilus assembly protein PilF
VIIASMAGWFGWRKLRSNQLANADRKIASTTDTRLPAPSKIQRPQPKALAAQYFSPTTIELKGLKPSHKTQAQAALQAYQANDYGNTVSMLEALKAEYTKVPESLRMLMGVAYLGGNRASEASRILLPLMYGTSEFDDQARWYLALAYFRQGNMVQGMGLMEEVRRHDGHFNQAEAQRFLGQLKGETGI